MCINICIFVCTWPCSSFTFNNLYNYRNVVWFGCTKGNQDANTANHGENFSTAKKSTVSQEKSEESVNGKELKIIDDGQEEHGNSDADINTDEDEKSASTSVWW